MDDLKLFAKSTNQIDSLVLAVHWYAIWNKEVRSTYMERGKVIITDGIRLPDGQQMKDIDKIGYPYLGYWKLLRSKRKK